jgi:hypothetical protein
MSQPERFFFVHLQKTAGTTLRWRMMRYFGAAALCPNKTDHTEFYAEAAVSLRHLRERMAARGHEVRVVAGHFPLCTAELLGGGFRIFTLLREPIERTLSYLRQRQQREPHDRHKTLEEIYDDPFVFSAITHNHMTKMFSLTVDELSSREMKAGMMKGVTFTRERLERAKANLASLDLVGVQERFEEFCEDLDWHFGWSLGPYPKWVNSTEQIEVSDALRERIARDHADDIELYELARKLTHERHERRSATMCTGRMR